MLPNIRAQRKTGKLCRLFQLGPLALAHTKADNTASLACVAAAGFFLGWTHRCCRFAHAVILILVV
jgi:hypothetical protein